jgi:hypothetical protein
MPWVKGHYARPARTSRRSQERMGLIALAVIAAILLIWYVSSH